MEDVQAADHRWLVHVWQVVDRPRDTSQLGIHLDQNLRNDGSQVLSPLNGLSKDHLGRNRVLGQEEPLDVIVQRAFTLGSWKNQNDHLDILTILKLGFELSNPSVRPHAWSDSVHRGFRAVVTHRVKALLHSTLELVGHLSVSVSVEDAPRFERWLREHLGLDLTVDIANTFLDVERVWSTATGSAHDEVSCIILPA